MAFISGKGSDGMRNERMNRVSVTVCIVFLCAALSGASHGAGPADDYNVVLEITNTTPEAQANWPVIMTVYKVFGRNLPAGSLNAKGYHVYDDGGTEIPHMIEAIPRHDQQGNNEIVFVVPKIAKGATLRYRVTNTAEASSKRTRTVSSSLKVETDSASRVSPS